MPAYATVVQFEAYVEGWTTDDAAALDRYLERATRTIDRLLGAWTYQSSGAYAGLKVDPTKLAAWEAEALADATCAQAEYLIEVGPVTYTRNPGVGRVKGPDFEVETKAPGGVPRIGPKVAGELARIRHLRRLSARATA